MAAEFSKQVVATLPRDRPSHAFAVESFVALAFLYYWLSLFYDIFSVLIIEIHHWRVAGGDLARQPASLAGDARCISACERCDFQTPLTSLFQ